MYTSETGSGAFSGWGGLIAILVVLFLFGNGSWGGNRANAATDAYALGAMGAMNRNGIATMDIINGQHDIERSICAAGYANQSLTNGLQRDILNGNYGIAQSISNSTAALHAAVTACCCENQKGLLQLGNALERLSCDIIDAVKEDGAKTRQQAADYRLQDVQQQFNFAQNTISNDRQSQYILGQLGRYVTNQPECGCCKPHCPGCAA